MPYLRISLTDKAIAQLPAPKNGWYLARDTVLQGFFVVVGKRKKDVHRPGRPQERGARVAGLAWARSTPHPARRSPLRWETGRNSLSCLNDESDQSEPHAFE